MKITNFYAGQVEIVDVKEVGTTFWHNKTHHTQTVNDILVKLKSDNFTGNISLDRKQATRMIKLLQRKLVVRKTLITQATRNNWAKNKR